MKKVLYLFVALLMTLPAMAQNRKWVNDPDHSRIGFEIGHASLSIISGHFSDFEIKVTGDVDKLEDVRATVRIKAASIDTGVEARNKHLRTPDFFDAEKYPYITFETTAVRPIDETHFTMEGNLTMRGVTKPVSLEVEQIGERVSPFSDKYTAGFRLKGTVNRLDYSIGTKFVPKDIADKVKIICDTEFFVEE